MIGLWLDCVVRLCQLNITLRYNSK